ncbi:MAG: transposase, partial [Bacteroidota bacterium]
PDLELAYKTTQELGNIYSSTKIKSVAYTRLAQWFNRMEETGFKSFQTVNRTIQNHYETILNYFDRRSTNAAAESFNAKIKALRSQFRGVRNVSFFLYRLSKIYAYYNYPTGFLLDPEPRKKQMAFVFYSLSQLSEFQNHRILGL